jgi:hypothetical protein
MRRNHRPNDWLLVTTPSGQHRLRAGHIGQSGLLAVETRRPPRFSEIAWKDVELIERRNAYPGTGRFLGILVGAFGGLVIGNVAGEASTAVVCFLAVTTLGGVVGGSIGDGVARVTPLYDARAEPEGYEGSEFIADDVTRIGDSSRPEQSVDYLRVAQSARPRDLLRVYGDFGWIAGRVGRIDSLGLHDIRRDRRHDPGLGAVPDPISWSSVTGIDRRGGGASKGALIGGLIGGLVLGAAAAAMASSEPLPGGSRSPAGSALAAGFGIGGLLGGGVGALIGATRHGWHPVPGLPASP